MVFDFLRSAGHSEMTAAVDVLAIVWQSASPILSRIAILGQIGYLFEVLTGTAVVVMGTVAVLYCLCGGTDYLDIAHIGETCNPSNNDPQTRARCASKRDVEITVRLDDGFLQTPHRHRCIVTIHGSSGDLQDTGLEVWYARDEK